MQHVAETLTEPLPVRFSKKDMRQIDKRRRAFGRSAFIRLAVKSILSRPDAYELLRDIHEKEASAQ